MVQDLKSKAKFYIRSEFFGEVLTDRQIEELIKLGRPIKAPEDAIIFEKGDPGNGFMLLLDGIIVIRTYSVDGKEAILNIIVPGEIFGEMTLPDGAPRSAEAVAKQPAEYLFFERTKFLDYLVTCPPLALNFLGFFGRRCRALSDEIEQSVFLNLEQRLAKKIEAYMDHFGESEPDGSLRIAVTQADLGSMLGTSRESINKHIRKWVRRGVVRSARGFLQVRDADFIRAKANEEVY